MIMFECLSLNVKTSNRIIFLDCESQLKEQV